MQDQELYRRILGIEAPWQVERVELKLEQGEVHVYLEHEDKRNGLVHSARLGKADPIGKSVVRASRLLDGSRVETSRAARS